MVKKRDKRNQAKKRKIHFCHHRACHSNLKKSKAMKAHNLARHKNSTKDCNTCMRNCFQTRERAGDARPGATHQEELRRFSKVQNLRHVLRKRRSRVPFSVVDWWTHRLSPTQATLTPTVGDFLFHILPFLSSSCSSSHCCFACSCRVTPTDELQSFRGTYSLGLFHTFL